MKFLLLCLAPLMLMVDSCKVLSLSGGGSYGAFEAGVFSRLIQDNKAGWDLITGVSAGSINTVYLSTVKKEDEKTMLPYYKSLWGSISNKDVYSYSLFLNGQSALSTVPLRGTLNKIFKDRTPIRDFIISSTSLSLGGKVLWDNRIINTNNKVDAIMSSSAIPLLFPPVEFNGDYFVDGGFSGNILLDEGIQYCIDKGAQQIIVDVIVCGKTIIKDDKYKNKQSLLGLVERLFNILINQVEYYELSDENLNKITNGKEIIVNLYEYQGDKGLLSMIEFKNGLELFDEGFNNYKKTTFGKVITKSLR